MSSGTEAVERARVVRLLAMDVDGTLTDGGIVIAEQGELSKRFSVRDGLGLRLLAEQGIELAIVTGRQSGIVARRAAELRIRHVLQAVDDKATALRGLCASLRLDCSQAAFVGDDLPDLPAMRAVGLAACVADACEEVRAASHWVAKAAGGAGAVRELAEFILRAQGRWQDAVARFDPGSSVSTAADRS